MAKYEYFDRSPEDVHRSQRQSDSKYDRFMDTSFGSFRPKEGENCIRIVPWLNGAMPKAPEYAERWGRHWGVTITVHYGVGGNRGSYLCLDKMKGQPCPVCDVWRSDKVEEIGPTDRILCWLVDRNQQKSGLQWWAMPLTVSKDISIASERKGTGQLLKIDDWNKGYDIFFDVEGSKKQTKYKRVQADTQSSYLAENERDQDKLLDDAFAQCLPDLLKYYDADYLQKILMGQKEPGEERQNDRGDTSDRRRRPTSDEYSGDREETSSRSSRASGDDSDYSRARRGEEPDSRERSSRDTSDDGGSRRRGEPDGSNGAGHTAARRGDEGGRDREAESANEAREAQSSRSSGDREDTSSRRGDEEAPAMRRGESPGGERDQARERLRDMGQGSGRDRRR
jgi:hypothetical protein